MDFEALYSTYFPKVYNYIYYRLLNRDQTDDLVSVIFTRIFENLDSYDESKAHLSTWVFTIARNTLINESKKKRPSVSIDDAPDIPADTDLQLEYIRREERKALYRELMRLSEREREIIALKFFAEKTNRKIAEELVMNESTVGSVVFGAMKKLRRGLGEQIAEGRVTV